MEDTRSEEIKMIEELIEGVAVGKKVDLNAKPVREVVTFEQEGQGVDTLILSMEYSGSIDGKPFKFKKSYSFAEDTPQYALDCLLIANNRLQMDYDRLKEAGIPVKDEFFTFQNSFMGLTGDASVRSPALRLQDFIHLCRAGASVTVDVSLKTPDIVLKQDDAAKKGFGCMAAFAFTTKEGTTTIEKIYSLGSYDDSKKYQIEIKKMANRRMERDCERLRRGGIDVGKLEF